MVRVPTITISTDVSDQSTASSSKDDSNYFQNDPVTLFEYHDACQNSNLKKVKQLVKDGMISLHNDYKESNKMTGLHWACINNKLEVVDFLVKSNVNVNCQTAVDYKLSNETPLQLATKYGYVYIVHYLLQNGADYTVLSRDGFNLLHLAVKSSNIMNILYILFFLIDPEELDLKAKDNNGRTALHLAILLGDIPTTKVLLKFGASYSIVDANGITPLQYAFQSGNKDILKCLVQYSSTTNEYHFPCVAGYGKFNIVNEVLNECGLDKHGQVLERNLEQKFIAKILIFTLPSLIIAELSIIACFNVFYSFIALPIFLKAGSMLLNNVLLPIHSPKISSRNAYFKSPILPGVLFTTFNCMTCFWSWKIRYVTKFQFPVVTIFFYITTLLMYYLFFKLLKSDAGKIPEQTDRVMIRKCIKDLLNEGKYNDSCFSVEKWIRIPIRSKLSTINNEFIARFDHYCVWLNNDIGLRNHKMYFFFLLALEGSLLSFISLSVIYFAKRDIVALGATYYLSNEQSFNEITKGDIMLALFSMVVLFMSAFLSNVLIEQAYQITKGLTFVELQKLMSLESNNKVLFSKPFIQNDYFNIKRHELRVMSSSVINTTSTEYGAAIAKLRNTEDSKLMNRIISRRLREKNRYDDTRKNVFQKKFGFNVWYSISEWNREIESYQDCNLPSNFLAPTKYGSARNIKDFFMSAELNAPFLRRLFLTLDNSNAVLNGTVINYNTIEALPEGEYRVIPIIRSDSNARLV